MNKIFSKVVLITAIFLMAAVVSYSQSNDELLEYLHGGKDKTWVTVGFYLEGLTGFQDCRLDDKFVFSGDGTYRYDGGKKLCGGEDNKRIKTGVWEKMEKKKMLVFNKGTSYEYVAKIVSSEDGFLILTTSYHGLEVKGVYQSKN